MKLTRISRWRSSSSGLWQLADGALSQSFFDEIFLTGEVKIESPVSETRILFLPKTFLYWTNSNSNPNPPSSTPRRCFKFDLWATILFFPNAIFGLTYKNQRFLLHGICTRKQIWKSDLLRISETPETGELKTKQETNLYTLIFLDICSKCLQVCLIERRSWEKWVIFLFLNCVKEIRSLVCTLYSKDSIIYLLFSQN